MELSGSESDGRFTVAFLGPLGTYTHEAAYKRFADHAQYLERKTIADVFSSLSPSVPLGVVPQENSTFGSVIETCNALRGSHPGFVRGEVLLKIDHCLLVRKGVKLDEIRKVMSHEQALGQCQEFLATHLPLATLEKSTSTAAAARALLDNPPECAAICSQICATLFQGLEVLHQGIQGETMNFTRFYVVAHSRETVMPFRHPLDRKALVRISAPKWPSKPSSTPRSIVQLLDSLRLDVTFIDRRPSVSLKPFHDVYFVGVCNFVDEPGRSSEDLWGSWTSEVDEAAERVRRTGGEIDVLGVW
ncbi:uncharacterized protein LACBIDRAFT_300746 [Laccaria bicolor S238N-H82]|uniref:prephenate dehydratase n=1 Tax=Laccaria bicolor (strain S238N-H82 / ATCC MYA-4686) TaxID=486041 RepID=B0CQ85_LACBS|nr:uncharacterized protein LACBIDRAFT_300746 [Laccaria bicolor S238N-H82]EDR15630.1 predicted protein [Laccaria bicolor S238N-H82]|eukprot:XP_001873838.1 predicted protein [Laccaria bicolor S238N-H82]